MKKIPKFVLLGIVVLVAAVGAVYYMAAPAIVPLTEVRARTAELSFIEEGTLAADKVVRIYPLVQGRLIQVNVREGQHVRAGDVLCVIDPEPLQLHIDHLRMTIEGYRAQMRNEADRQRSDSALTQEQLRLQEILIEQSRRDLDQARRDLARTESLFQERAIPAVQLENARLEVEKYESALLANRRQLSVIAAGHWQGSLVDYYDALIAAAEVNIARLERDIENSIVAATVDGVISALSARDTNFLTDVLPAAEITVFESNTIETYVSTNDIGSIRVGDTVYLTLKRREGDIDFTGRVIHVNSFAEVRLSTLGVEERRVKVQISPLLDELQGTLLGAGFDVDVTFVIYREDDKLTAPRTAFFKDGGRDMLWVVRNGRIRATEVVTGMELRTETVVESGLAEGDFVVTNANNRDLRDGLRVR